jgi:acetylornithine deacetylase/succinyl-diaminopimelate desuccinylase-like protein
VEWTFLAVMDEEAANKGARAAAAGDFASDLVVVLEPTDLRVVTAHKGVIWLDVFTEGVACHGSTPERGRNAIYAMRRVLEILEKKIVPDLARHAHGKLGGASLNVGTISGGSKINIVPDRCRIEVDVRLVPGLKPEAVRAEIEAALRKEISGVEVKEQRHSAPLDTSESLPWVKRLGEAARGFATAPWFSDASVLGRAGRPAVCLGPGSIAQAHTRDEFILLRDLEEGADLFRRWIALAES